MLKDFVPRLYQETILSTCSQKNTLVVLPTGMGKTGIALLLSIQRLKVYPKSKILFLATTKPLAEQHLQTFKQFLDIDESKLTLFTGEIPPAKRAKLWNDTKIAFSTPQGLENDIINNTINLEEVSLIVFDEAHRATGDYAYVFISKQYNKKANYPRILALTASPGNDLQTIEDVCKNLFVEEVEIRTDQDPDVAQYVQPIDVQTIKVELPEDLKQLIKILEQCIRTKVSEIKQLGITEEINTKNKKELLLLQARLHAEIAQGESDFSTLKTISLLAEIMKVQHALELAESQGVTILVKYFEKIFEEAQTSKTKAVQNLAKDIHFKTAYVKTQKLLEQKIEHPKLNEIRKIIEQEVTNNKFVKILLFTQFRDSAVRISEEISKIQNIVPSIFVGQTKKGETGLSQKKQIEMLQQFKDGLFNVLIATSVAEEGLDIPKVDLVIFYEPIPSAIRSIQRRGRTGRQDKGRVIMLIAKGTRDEAYNWASKQKEKKMQYFLTQLRTTLKQKLQKQQPTLTKFVSEEKKLKIFADYREKGSNTIKTLIDSNVELKLEMLNCADYVLSERTAVELKKVPDFVDSIIDGRLLQQLKNLKQNYYRPLIIIEGEQNIYSVRNVHPNAIRGMLATIAVSYGIPILQTKNEEETAALLLAIAKREQEESSKEFSLHADKKPLTATEQQEYVVSALPSIGPSLAKELLKQFGTVKNVVNATHEELQKVEGVGETISKRVKEIIEKEYNEEK